MNVGEPRTTVPFASDGCGATSMARAAQAVAAVLAGFTDATNLIVRVTADRPAEQVTRVFTVEVATATASVTELGDPREQAGQVEVGVRENASGQCSLSVAVVPGTLEAQFLPSGEALAEMASTVWPQLGRTRRLAELALIGDTDRAQLASLAGSPSRAEPQHAASIFERAGRTYQHRVAVRCGENRLTYAELDRAANRLARHLIDVGAGPEHLVALALPRSLDLVVAVLAVLKSGAAYVPLDLDYPVSRLAFMVADSAPVAVLTQAANSDHHAFGGNLQRILLDDPHTASALAARSADPLTDADRTTPLSIDQPMYVIYTSGSTGQPKGVVVSHRGVSDLVATQHDVVGVCPDDRVLQWASISFDAAFWDLTLALTAGAELVLARPVELLPGEPLAQTLRGEKITVATLPPAAVAALPDEQDLLFGGTLVSTGDVCTPAMVRRWGARCRLINGYGPTETTVGATLSAPLTDAQHCPVGRPFAGTTIHLLDRLGRLVPLGVPGEIVIGGPGVARGYLRRPDLTADRFRRGWGPDPGRVYRSGDIGVWHPDGQLFYGGRVDRQVKIRGFRVELSEIENALLTHPDVELAVALVRGETPSDKYVAAYVQPRRGCRSSPAELRMHLTATVPNYLVPASITVRDVLPVTPNGKIDLEALRRDPPRTLTEQATAVRSASTVVRHVGIEARQIASAEFEVGENGSGENVPGELGAAELIRRLFVDLLHRSDIAVDDDFYALGGDSISMVRLIRRMRSEHGLQIEITAAFEHPTPRGIAAAISARAE